MISLKSACHVVMVGCPRLTDWSPAQTIPIHWVSQAHNFTYMLRQLRSKRVCPILRRPWGVMILVQLLLLDSHIFSSVFVSICLSFVAWQTKLCCFAATAASSNICKTKQSGNLRMLFMACHCYDTNVTPRNPKRMVIIRRRFVLPWWVVLLLWQQQAMATAAWHEEIPWISGTWENAWTIYFTYVLHIMFRFLARDTEIL